MFGCYQFQPKNIHQPNDTARTANQLLFLHKKESSLVFCQPEITDLSIMTM